MIRLIDVLLWCLFIIMTLPKTNAKVFFIQLQPEKDDTRSFNFELNKYKSRPPMKSTQPYLLQNLLSLLTPHFSEKSKNKCIRLFGSIYGTKAQRQECIEKLRKKQTSMKPEDLYYYRPNFSSVAYDDMVYVDSDSFLDYTRHNDKQSTDYSMEYEAKLPDYTLKPYESRTKYTLSNEPREPPNYIYDKKWKPGDAKSKYLNYRKSYAKLAKRNMNVETSEESSSSETEESDEKQKEDTDEAKPKRFEVIDNEKKSKLKKASKPKYVETSDSTEEVSIEVEKPKRVQSARYPKPLQNKMNIMKKQKKTNQAKEYYLQANRFVDPDSDDDEFRRRLQSFLPKRYHWNVEEIRDLGYYWFNGPQGRYPHYALRP